MLVLLVRIDLLVLIRNAFLLQGDPDPLRERTELQYGSNEHLVLGRQETLTHPTSVEDDLLHTMVEDLLAREAAANCGDDCPSGEATEQEQDVLLQHARTPLYEGCTYSTLRASLEILNLQAMFGWSSTNVDSLLRYTF